LELAKLCSYGRSEGLSTAFFVVFLVVWIAMRLVYFPLWIIRSCLYEVISEIADKQPEIPPEPHYTLFNGLLLTLLVLHIYWTFLIIKVVIRKLTSGKTEDVRED
jgi:ceramide synthetase